MGNDPSPQVKAVLGPTNTGKTHLAVERLCAHSSGMIGFPLRLLAREVYDRVVAIKGAHQVALITGEEKILPPDARYFLCTAESMPLDRDVSFLALDEAQMGSHDERGHIFTDRLLHARGRDETMILGSQSLRPLVRALLPEAEIITRPRFSTLSCIEPKKLSRLPKRSAVVAFSAEQVYALGEMLRRQRGGVAVVMGSLSPRTRNAQVAMYQAGEVDFLVATDAIGMGLNMDIRHVAFASVHKFDGRRKRRLTVPEISQIAGRAGRHQTDGTFGSMLLGTDAGGGMSGGLTAEEVLAVEEHVVPPLTQLKWRNTRLDTSSVAALVHSLDRMPERPELVRSHDGVDLAALRTLSHDPLVIERTARSWGVRQLWAACQLPDYRKTSPETHARLIARLFRHISEGNGTIPQDWIAAEVARLDSVTGDIETIAGRIAGIRTWSYIANRPDWTSDPDEWAGRTRALEDKLSDALHERLIQRFVDRRLSVLMREAGGRNLLDIDVSTEGEVAVDGTAIGQLDGFTFTVDPSATHVDKRRVMAAAERALGGEMGRRAKALTGSSEADFQLSAEPGARQTGICWRGALVASLEAGRDVLRPRIRLTHGAAGLPQGPRANVQRRLELWLAGEIERHLRPLLDLERAVRPPQQAGRGNPRARHAGLDGAGRGLAVQLIQSLGCMARDGAADVISGLDRDQRRALTRCGVRIGAYSIFVPGLLKPAATRWRAALWSVRAGVNCALASEGAVSFARDDRTPNEFYAMAGYWRVAGHMVRVDLVERVAEALRSGGQSIVVPEDRLISACGLTRPLFGEMLVSLGYRRCSLNPQTADGPAAADSFAFRWSGKSRRQRRTPEPGSAPSTSPFAVLGKLRGKP